MLRPAAALLVAGLLASAFFAGKLAAPEQVACAVEGRAALPDRVALVPPKGYTLYGGADIESRVDRDGTIFVAATGETPGGFGGLMWMQKSDGRGGWTSTAIELGELYPGGRGSLSVERDGQLYLTQWQEDSKAWRLRIKQWKPER